MKQTKIFNLGETMQGIVVIILILAMSFFCCCSSDNKHSQKSQQTNNITKTEMYHCDKLNKHYFVMNHEGHDLFYSEYPGSQISHFPEVCRKCRKEKGLD